MVGFDHFRIAIDDGHSNVKAVLLEQPDADPKTVTFESAGRAGAAALMDLGGGQAGSDIYVTDGQRFTIGPRHLLSETLETRTSDFPTSAFNRVLVAHALRQLGLPSGGQVTIATGLPLREWIAANRAERLEAKKANIGKPVAAMDGWERPEIVEHHVLPEAISAYLHAVRTGIVAKGESIAIIDIGGRTMDTAIIRASGPNNTPVIDPQKSGSDEIGALAVRDRLRHLIAQKHTLDQVSDTLVDQALKDGQIRLFNRPTDCADLVRSACRDIATNALNAARHRIGNGADLSAVLLVGGGQHLLDITHAWEHAIKMDAPEFANAMGMLDRLCQINNKTKG
jgi:plasmid segregation protein ParM